MSIKQKNINMWGRSCRCNRHDGAYMSIKQQTVDMNVPIVRPVGSR